MYAILAFVPIVLVIILMVAFNVQAKKAIPAAWIRFGAPPFRCSSG